MSNEIYVSTDIESDGPSVLEHSMISLGASVVGDPDKRFYVEIMPIHDAFVPEALAVSGLDRERLKREGASPFKAMTDFVNWVESLDGYPVAVTFSTWDWSFLYPYMLTYAGRSPFYHSSLDMKSYYAGEFNVDFRQTGKRGIKNHAPELLRGLPKHSHVSVEDAIEQGELFRRMLHYPKVDWG